MGWVMEPIEAGHEMAKLLVDAYPDMDSEKVADAILHTLERTSINIEGFGEGKLAPCLYALIE